MPNNAIFIGTFLPLFIILLMQKRRRQRIAKYIINKRNGVNYEMRELLKALIGKKCSVHCLDESLAYGTYIIKEVNDNGLLCEDAKGRTTVVNIDLVSSVTEIPEKKKKNEK